MSNRKTKQTLLFLFAFWFALPVLWSQCPTNNRFYVDADANSGANDGTSWADAFTDLQDALLEARTNCTNVTEIWVAAGTYKPDEGVGQTDNDINATFRLRNSVAIYGGFSGGEGSLAARPSPLALTILSGDIDGNDADADGDNIIAVADITGANAKNVVTSDGADVTAILDGFTITAGDARGLSFELDAGGGMLNKNSASPIVRNCTFSGNVAKDGGAIFTANSAGSLTISNCSFLANQSTGDGGAIYIGGAEATIVNTIISGNMAVVDGGAIINSNSSISITNVTIVGNMAARSGGGIANLFSASSTTVTNSIIWNNRDNSGTGTAAASVVNLISAAPTSTTYSHSLVQNITADDMNGNKAGDPSMSNYPAFVTPVDPTTAPTAAGNLRLQACSPAIDAGNTAAVPATSTTDLDNNPRVFDATGGNAVDMGAYEFQQTYDVCTQCLPTGNIVFVNASASGNNDGSSWTNAFTDLQDALSQAASCPNKNQIWVAAGTYKPSAYPAGCMNCATDRDFTFLLRGGISLYGGFNGTETMLNQRNISANTTILSGDIGTLDDVSDNVYHVVLSAFSGNASTTRLDGFTITEGYAFGIPNAITVNGQVISRRAGGGVATYNGTNILTNNSITGNSALTGGGVATIRGVNTLVSNNISSNSDGGGLYLEHGENTLVNNIISGNTNSSGGGIVANGSTNTLVNNSISENTATTRGGGIFVGSGMNTLTNNIIWGNSAPEGESLFNNLGTLAINYSIVQGGFTGTGNLDEDPQFIDAANGNLRLQACSPAIDAGNTAAVPAGTTTDLDGNPRFFNSGTVDMGAYEYQDVPVTAPTGTLAITNSTCNDCSLSGGSIVIGTVSGSGGTLEYSTDNGATWSSDLPEYDQDGLAQTILASVLSANGCRSASTQVGMTAPGTCPGPAAPTGTLAITNSICTDCSLSGGSIAIGSVSGSGGTLEYSTDNGANWSSTLPTYDQDGPAQTILASVLSANGCRSASTQVGMTAPGTCPGPAAPTGTLAITNSICTDCSLSGGSIAIGSVSGSGGTLEYSTDNGANWSSDLPEYDQDGPAQTIFASVLSANGCRSSSTQVGMTAPGVCNTPMVTPNVTLEITNSICTGCMVGGGSIEIIGISGSSGQTTEYSTDGGTTWSDILPTYNQTGPAQTILASILLDNGCRGPVLEVGVTAPGECVTPAAPTGTLAITNSTCTDCVLSGGSIAIGTVSGTGGTVEYSTDNGTTWSSDLPEYDQDGPAQIILASVLSANGCRSSSSQVGMTAPGECAPVVANCQNQTVSLGMDGNGSLPASALNNASSGCSTLSFTVGNAATLNFDCSDIGINTVLLTVTDALGNEDTCTSLVTVEDNNLPIALCANPTVNLTSDGTTSVAAIFFDGGSSSTCSSTSFLATQTDFDCGDVGSTIPVTLTVTAQSNNQTATCIANVTVADPNNFCCAPPEAICANITVQLGPNGFIVPLTAAQIGGQSTAECGLQSEMISEQDFLCADIGQNTVTYTITDVNGDSDACTATVTVEDKISPTAACLSSTVELGTNGAYTLLESDVFDAANSSDNCSISSVSFPGATYTCDDAGLAFPVLVTIEDPSGNMDDCTAIVTVEIGDELPFPWTANDIGDQGDGSFYEYDPCVNDNPNLGDFTIGTGGYNLIPQNADNLAFASVSLCGDGGIQARIRDVAGGYAGLMIRESSDPGSKMIAVYS
ncbi:MAG: right-handed parallel beta-helix repeat-containing protein, partial [bacterium]|nr:right-handed parallel beta-helix repeat-containing protein [bacterium]